MEMQIALNSWQTTIGLGNGGWGYDFIPIAFMVDECMHIYISGHSATSSLYTTPDALYTTGGFYLMALDPEATGVDFATYYPANHVDGGTSRFDPSGRIYQAVCDCGGFVTTANAYSTTNSVGCDIGVFKIDFELINFAAAIASPAPSGCAPYTVNFINSSTGNQFFWDFDDNGQTSTDFSPTYTFNNTGTYDVMLIAIDSGACNVADTIIVQIDVLASNATSTSSATVCDSYTWNGITYTLSGTYTHIVGAAACDSTAILNLTINNSTSNTATQTACDAYTWALNGANYTSSGTYTYLTTNIVGCDSTVILNLTISNDTTITIIDTSCGEYSWNGTVYDSSGIYHDSLITANGCDSILILNLTVFEDSSVTYITACDSAEWNGVWYYNDTTVTDTGFYTSYSFGGSTIDNSGKEGNIW
jgi:PKD repeat protein